MRLISFSLTTPQFLDGSKTVTRRLGWGRVKAGEHLRAVEKSMGIPRGSHVKPLGELRLTNVRREPLDEILRHRLYGQLEVKLEGLPQMTPEQFVEFFCKTHTGCFPEREITRLEFVKL